MTNDNSILITNQTKSLIDPENSKRITSLRYILSVLVVFIHNNFTSEDLATSLAEGNSIPVFAQSPVGEWIQLLISGALGSCAVPLFFMFSAYLFFKKPVAYSKMLKKKAKGLFVPYVLWIFLNILLISFAKILVSEFNSSLLNNPENIPLCSYGFWDWLKAFTGFGFDKYNHPFAGQFWYVRDLLILFLISPGLQIIYRKFPKSSLIFCIFIYISGITTEGFGSDKTGLLFFTLGYFWAEKDFSPFRFADSIGWCEIIFMFAFSILGSNLFFKGNSVVSSLEVFFSCLFFLKLSGCIVKSQKIFDLTEKLAPFSFFLFAVHMPLLLLCVQKVWLHFFPMKNTFFCLFEYFGVNVVVILIGTFLAFVLRKICPPLFCLLNGGRK